MSLNVDILNFGLGQEPQTTWRHNCVSFTEAFGKFAEDASVCAYETLVLKIENKIYGIAVRINDRVEIVISSLEMTQI